MPPLVDHKSRIPQFLLVPSFPIEDSSDLDDFDLFKKLNLDESFYSGYTFSDVDPSNFTEAGNCGASTSGRQNYGVCHDCMWSGTCNETFKHRPEQRLEPLKRLEEGKLFRAKPRILVPPSPRNGQRNRAVQCGERSFIKNSSDVPRSARPPDSSGVDSALLGKPGGDPHALAGNSKTSCDADTLLCPVHERLDSEDGEDRNGRETCGTRVTGREVQTLKPKEDDEGDVAPRSSVTMDCGAITITRHIRSFSNDHSYYVNEKEASVAIPRGVTSEKGEDRIGMLLGRVRVYPGLQPAARQTTTRPLAARRPAEATPCPSINSSSSVSACHRDAMQASLVSVAKCRALLENTSGGQKLRAQPKRWAKGKRRGVKRFSSSLELDWKDRGPLHNSLERERRMQLRSAFENLRLAVPHLQAKARTSKVVILQEAIRLCRQLTDEENTLYHDSAVLEGNKTRLMTRVSFLRKQLLLQRQRQRM